MVERISLGIPVKGSDAFHTLVRLQGFPSADASGYFAVYRNYDALHDGPNPPTIPHDPVARFIWEVEVGAEPWIPTVEEQDARTAEHAEAQKARRGVAV